MESWGLCQEDQLYLIKITLSLATLIVLALALGQGTKVKTNNDTIVIIGVALIVCFLLTAAFLANDIIFIKVHCEPLISNPGFLEIYRVCVSKTYDLYIISTTLPMFMIDIHHMPAAIHTFSDINQHPALLLLSQHLDELCKMLVQLDISFQNRMMAPESYKDELELNKLKGVLNLIYKIQAILIYYIPSLPLIHIEDYEWAED